MNDMNEYQLVKGDWATETVWAHSFIIDRGCLIFLNEDRRAFRAIPDMEWKSVTQAS